MTKKAWKKVKTKQNIFFKKRRISRTDIKKSLLTFVVVGGGFSGIETVGALNDFVRETIATFYKNIDGKDVRVVPIEGEDKIMNEADSELGTFVLKRLEERGVEFILNTFVDSASKDHIRLASGITIPTYTVVWTGV